MLGVFLVFLCAPYSIHTRTPAAAALRLRPTLSSWLPSVLASSRYWRCLQCTDACLLILILVLCAVWTEYLINNETNFSIRHVQSLLIMSVSILFHVCAIDVFFCGRWNLVVSFIVWYTVKICLCKPYFECILRQFSVCQTIAIWDWTVEGDTPLCTASLSNEYGEQSFVLFNPEDTSQLVSNSESRCLFYSWVSTCMEYYTRICTYRLLRRLNVYA